MDTPSAKQTARPAKISTLQLRREALRGYFYCLSQRLVLCIAR